MDDRGDRRLGYAGRDQAALEAAALRFAAAAGINLLGDVDPALSRLLADDS